MARIIVVGSINMDLTIQTSVFPNAGETVLGDSFHTDLGGKGANQAIAAANWGSDVIMIGSVGDDLYGEMSCRNLAQHNVDISPVIIQQAQNSGVAMIILNDNDNRIIVNSGANALLSSEDIIAKQELFTADDIVLSQLEVPMDTVLTTFTLAKERGCITVLNPSPICKLSGDLLEKTDILILNEHEAEILTGMPVSTIQQAKECIPMLLAFGIETAILTLGENGCVYSHNSDIIHQPARIADAVDTTGAGDSFCGTYLSALVQGVTPPDAILIATTASSLAVTKKGTSSSFPTREEIISTLEKEGVSIELSGNSKI